MTRDELLVRGLAVDGLGWEYGFISKYSAKRQEAEIDNGEMTVPVVFETVGRNSGLRDKHSMPIYEHDCVKFGQRLYRICFECGSFALLDDSGHMISKIGGHNNYCYPLMTLYTDCCWEENSAFDIEVIGNIHVTPGKINKDY